MEVNRPITEAGAGAVGGVDAGGGDGARAEMKEDDTRSHTSRKSAASRLSDSTSVKLRAAQVKKELASRKREQFLREQRLRREQFELNERLELQKLEDEKDNAQFESSMWREQAEQEMTDANAVKHPDVPLLPVEKEDTAKRTQQWFEQEHCGNVDNKMNACDVSANHNINRITMPSTHNNHDVQRSFDNNAYQLPHHNVSQPHHSYNHNPNLMAMALSLPKPDMQTFSGDPIDYWNFVHSFEVNIASRVQDDRLRLSYLIQFTMGKAREAIENCVLLDPMTGYSRARVILQDQFGRNYIVARAHLERVINRPRTTDSQSLWDLARDMRRCQMTTSQMGYSADMSTTDNLLKIQHLLPVHLQSKWAGRAHALMEDSVMPNFSHMTDFIEESAKVASNVFGKNVGRPLKQDKTSEKKARPKASTFNTGTKVVKPKEGRSCPCCSQAHDIEYCRSFKDRPVDERFSFVRNKGLCFNCLKAAHTAQDCSSTKRCGKDGCKRKHHSLLHKDDNREAAQRGAGTSLPTGAGQPSDNQAESNSVGGQREVSLRVLPVKVRGNGRQVLTWALLDHGSTNSLCERRLAEDLGLEGRTTTFYLTTVNQTNVQREGKEVSISIQGVDGTEVIDMPKVWTVDSLPTTHRSIPRQQDVNRWPHLKGLKLPTAAMKDVTLLIGGDTPEAFWVQDQRQGKKKEPYALRTPLGWTVMGPLGRRGHGDFVEVNNVNLDDQLHEQVQRFWQLDHVAGDDRESLGDSVEDRKARSLMEETVNLKDGHYEMGLPWRHFPPNLPNNVKMAESRLQSLKRRLEKDATLYRKYTLTMTDYLDKGFAKEVEEVALESDGPLWYLLHHPVTHPLKPDKVRVVFDCAAKSQGVSLNNQLLSGPDYTNKLVGVLLRFRQEKIALVADVEGMFHQVRVTPRDTNALRFLWWENGDLTRAPKTYKMLVHLFGATSSPSCAGFALQKTAGDNKEGYDADVLQIVKDNFYVDDCLKSVDSAEAAKRIIPQLCSLLKKGGFRLTKWVSNDKSVLATVPPTERAASVIDLDLDHLPIERTLGVLWNMESDMFSFKVTPKEVPITRRGILSATSSLYDPLGFVAPFTVNAKMLLQDLCAQGLGWDEKIQDQDQECWKAWLAELPDLTSLQIDRCFKPSDFFIPTYDLHVFCDASERAYAACAYLRIEDSGRVHSTFVMGKTRLCPIKKMTVPRLELSAAVLAVKLGQIVKEELRLPIRKVIYWTDSTAVLLYIRITSRRFRTFVANRVAEIQSKSDSTQWRHVDTKSNPADDGSRGLPAGNLARWISGPDFLLQEEQHWPKVFSSNLGSPPTQDLQDDPEVKKANAISVKQGGGLSDFISHYSSWDRLRRGVAWLLRAKAHLLTRVRKSSALGETGDLTPSELKEAELEIVKYVQREAFPTEFLGKGSREESSSMKKLNPILVNGTLRVGGRLDRSPVAYDVRHPMILPSNHHVTRLLIEHCHSKVGHSGAGMTWAALRSNYWILKGGTVVRRILGKCFKCRKRNAPRGKQMMADLPKEQVTPDKPPFTFTGVDYFGPFDVKQGRSQVKRYGCVFTCLTTRAVHLEIANSLDTDSFINALRRFLNRRGMPEKIFSDNGTNFRGGHSELKKSLAELNAAKVGRFLTHREIEWQFNPPGASHMGGVWERVIRSVRKILGNLLTQQTVTDKTLRTLMSEVEAILNARPLTPISADPRDEEPLTPNHLLLMRRSPSVSPGVFIKEDCYMRRRWRQTQYLAGQFWKRWRKEYLPLLQERQKWLKPQRNFKTDDLVLVADDTSPRGQWPLGRVTMTYPDRHGLVRQVEVRVGPKYYKRPISKLCLLEGQD